MYNKSINTGYEIKNYKNKLQPLAMGMSVHTRTCGLEKFERPNMMTHDHNHSHDHDHSHSHDHTHELTFEQKLEKLFGHWIDHNDSHKDTFYTWAGRAKEAGLDKIAANIEKAGKLSEDVTLQIREALNKLKG